MGRKRLHPKNKQTKAKWYQKENDWGNYVFDWTLGLSGETRREIFAVINVIVAAIIFLGFFGLAGTLGIKITELIFWLFGTFGGYVFGAIYLYCGVFLLIPNQEYRIAQFVGFFLLITATPAFLHLFIVSDFAREFASHGRGGGMIGYLISNPLRNGVGIIPTFLIIIAILVIAILMIFNLSLTQYFKRDEEDENDGKVKINDGGDENKISVFDSVKRKFNTMKKEPSNRVEIVEPLPMNVAPVQRSSSTVAWQYPSLDMLKTSDDKATPGNIYKNAEIIQNCLKSFNIEVSVGEVNVGPTVTQYTIKPNDGVKLNHIVSRQNDLALSLSAKSLRIEAPIPGKNLVGIEIPNKVSAKVTLKEVLKSTEFKAVKSKLSLALGRDVSGDAIAIDLEKMPHMLIAGSTGSGKSVCINTIIMSLLFNNSPQDLRLILVDPKRVELTNYNGIPHLLTAAVTEVDKTVSALKWAVWEMERRYKMFEQSGKRNIIAYNASPGPEGRLPYMVIIIDELADLMATSAKDVEASIVRLAQMARATGMHLIIATQRPSVDVLTGIIKANITSRIAFATASQIDSRTILDVSGAEKLLGNGDMLFLGNGLNKPRRIQGCYVSDKEIESLVEFLREKGEAIYDESITNFRSSKPGAANSGNGSEEDDLYDEAIETIMAAGKASASLLQRRLKVGYARAARLLDILEQNGVIGSADGAKPRDILSTGQSFGGSSSDQFKPQYRDNNFDDNYSDDDRI
ncbi:MAG: DNA translocase FtsK 4TM domain-containing protein [bacterium]